MKKQMRKIVFSFVIFCTILFYWKGNIGVVEASNMDMRAVWISYLDYGNLKDKSEDQFRQNVNTMYDQVISRKLNTVIVQVRAFDDAIYPSNYFKWCSYITSNPGGPGFDPLAIMIETAHNKGLRFEAWVNPYRINMNQSYEPGDEGVRNRIVSGIEEIVHNYNVDGIHFDDYFYRNDNPTPADQRRANVNELIRRVYAAIKAIKPQVVFGISPQGNIDNCRGAGADVDTWLSNGGYIDYIMPQLYWTDNYGAGGGNPMYSSRLAQWKSINRNNTTLYVGLALYKVVDKPATDIGWSVSSSNLIEQVQKASAAGARGYALFRYSFLQYDVVQTELNNLDSFIPVVDIGPISQFVTRLYQNILGREPDKEGLNYYINHLVSNRITAASVVDNFLSSPEFTGKKYSDREYINIVYKTCMNRNPDNGGLNYWLESLKQGMDRRGILHGVIESNEFAKLCSSYGINKGSLSSVEPRNINANLTRFVFRCYEKALGRKAEISGLNYHTQELLLKRVTPVQTAQNFIFSPEFNNKNLSDTEYVKTLYRTFMGREYDQSGLNYHLSRMSNGVSREEILLGFVYAPEFKAIMAEFGL